MSLPTRPTPLHPERAAWAAYRALWRSQYRRDLLALADYLVTHYARAYRQRQLDGDAWLRLYIGGGAGSCDGGVADLLGESCRTLHRHLAVLADSEVFGAPFLVIEHRREPAAPGGTEPCPRGGMVTRTYVMLPAIIGGAAGYELIGALAALPPPVAPANNPHGHNGLPCPRCGGERELRTRDLEQWRRVRVAELHCAPCDSYEALPPVELQRWTAAVGHRAPIRLVPAAASSPSADSPRLGPEVNRCSRCNHRLLMWDDPPDGLCVACQQAEKGE